MRVCSSQGHTLGVCVCVRVSEALPDVGDLLLSMSRDTWLSDSSVRPAAHSEGREGRWDRERDCWITRGYGHESWGPTVGHAPV